MTFNLSPVSDDIHREEGAKLLNFAIDATTLEEKLKFVSVSQVLSYPIIIFSVAQVALGSVLWSFHYSSIAVWLTFAGVTTLGGSIAALVWTILTKRRIRETTELYAQPTDSKLTNAVFLSSFYLVAGSLLVLAIIYARYDWNESFYTAWASNSVQWSDRFGSLEPATLKLIAKISLLVIASFNGLYFIFFLITGRAAYFFLNSHSQNMRKLVFITALLLMASTGALIYLSVNLCGNYHAYPQVLAHFPLEISQAAFEISIGIAVVTLFLFLTNWRRWRIGYFFFTVLLLSLFVLLVNLSGFAYRHATSVHDYYESADACPNRLAKASKSWLESYGCPNKYIFHADGSSISTDCQANQKGDIWEEDIGKDNAAKQHAQGCLNLACCGVVADLYSTDLFIFAELSLIVTLMIGILSIGTYYLWHIDRTNTLDLPKKLSDLGWLGAMLAVAIAWILVISLTSFSAPLEYGSAISYSSTPTTNLISMNATEFGDQACFTVKNLNFDYDYTKCPKEHCNGYKITALILAVDTTWSYPPDFHSPGLTFLSRSLKSHYFPKAASTDDFIGFQGTPADINTALQNSFLACPVTPGVDVVIQVQTFQSTGKQYVDYEVIPGGANRSITIPLRSTLVQNIKGTVKHEDSPETYSSIKGVAVSARRLDNSSIRIDPVNSTADGTFQLTVRKFVNSTPYLLKLAFSLNGYVSQTRVVQIGGFPEDNDLELGLIQMFKVNEKAADIQTEGSSSLARLTIFPVTALTAEPVPLATASLYTGTNEADLNKQTPIHVANIQEDGSIQMFNIPYGNYVLKVSSEKERFITHTRVLTVTKAQSVVYAAIPTKSANNDIRVVLQLQDNKTAWVYGTYNANSTENCVVSAMMPDCKGVNIISNQGKFDAGVVNDFGGFYYLFYVKPIPDSAGQTINLATSKVFIDVFWGKFDHSIARFYPPGTASSADSSQTWLAFCVDGRVGAHSVKPVSEYWKGGSGSVPDADTICRAVYGETPASSS